MKKKLKKETLKIKVDPFKVKNDDIHNLLQEINRGTGVQKKKKGKGSYTRKTKYKEDSQW